MGYVDAIIQKDRIFQLFGMTLEEAREGYARVAATVTDAALNYHDIAHGAFVFALADVAFSVVVNSVTPSVGVQWSMNIVRAAMPGSRVTAESHLVHRGRRLLVVDFSVRDAEGRLLCQGQATALPAERERFASAAVPPDPQR